jgi:hypothetical protein
MNRTMADDGTDSLILRYLREIDRKLDVLTARLNALAAEQARTRPFLEGILVLGKPIEVMHLAMRVDSTLSNTIAEFSAIHHWMSGINSRIRELEGPRPTEPEG